MGNTLTEIAQQLKDSNKKVQLIYAFNGMGKTRLSREFKKLIAPPPEGDEADQDEEARIKILYYNAFTEDLFYWDNDLEYDAEPKLIIQPNAFTDWIFVEQGQEPNIIENFQHYTSDKLTPHFNAEYLKDRNDPSSKVKAFSEVKFSFRRGDDEPSENIKISKGEESNLIWSIFYSLIEQVINVRNVPEPDDRETNIFDELEYIFIDDPVTSLDENHLIELAVSLASLINSSDYTNGNGIKFVITTHNVSFYNVLYNELKLNKKKGSYILIKHEDGSFELNEKPGDSNKSFSYHLFLMQTIEQAIKNNNIEKYHFMLLRNLYEKTASFLGYPEWSKLLPEDGRDAYYSRIINFTSHSTLSNETVADPTDPEKETVRLLLNHLIDNYNFWKEEAPNA